MFISSSFYYMISAYRSQKGLNTRILLSTGLKVFLVSKVVWALLWNLRSLPFLPLSPMECKFQNKTRTEPLTQQITWPLYNFPLFTPTVSELATLPNRLTWQLSDWADLTVRLLTRVSHRMHTRGHMRSPYRCMHKTPLSRCRLRHSKTL